MPTSTRTRQPSAAQIEAAKALLLSVGDPDLLRAQQRQEARAQKEAAGTVVTPAFVSSFLDVTGGVKASTAEPKPGKDPWVGASVSGLPVTTDDGGQYTVRVIVTQVKAPA